MRLMLSHAIALAMGFMAGIASLIGTTEEDLKAATSTSLAALPEQVSMPPDSVAPADKRIADVPSDVERRDDESEARLTEMKPDSAEVAAFLSNTRARMAELAALEQRSLVESLIEDLGLGAGYAPTLLRAASYARTKLDTRDVEGFLFAYTMQVSPDAQVQLQRRLEPATLDRLQAALPSYAARIAEWRKDRVRRAQAAWATKMVGDLGLALDLSERQARDIRVATQEFAREAWTKVTGLREANISLGKLRVDLLNRLAPLLGNANARLLRTRWQLHGMLGG